MAILPSTSPKHGTNSMINRHIGRAYEDVQAVAEHIEQVIAVHGALPLLDAYLGVHAEAPVTRPDGSELQNGDYYLKSPEAEVYYWVPDTQEWVTMDSTEFLNLLAQTEAARDAAKVSETNAAQSATLAGQHNSAALTSRNQAEQFKNTTEGYMQDTAQLKADTAILRDQAQDSADDAAQSVIFADAEADRATVAANRADTAKTGADAAKDEATLQAQAAETARLAALAQADRAESEATAAQNSAIAASASEQGASNLRDETEGLRDETITHRDTAKAHKDAAAASATQAGGSQTEAKASELAAKASENEAARLEGLAQSHKDAAQLAETGSVAAKTQAQTAQGLAETAQTKAETAQGLSEDARDASQGYRNEAETFRDQSGSNKDASATSASQSAASAVTAGNHATTAGTHSTNAGLAATDAGNSATAAANSASASETSRQASETAQSGSEAARDLAEQYRDTAELHKSAAESAEANALASEIAANSSAVSAGADATSANTSKENAQESADVAQTWAEYAETVANSTFVSGGFFDPSAGSEYPDVAGIEVDTIFIVSLPERGDSYTFTTGDLTGERVVSGDQILYDTPGNTWSLARTGLSGGAVTGIQSSHGGLDQGPIVVLDISDFGGMEETAIRTELDLKADKTQLDNYLPMTGGTLTGSLAVNASLIRVNGTNGNYSGWHQFEAQSSSGATYVSKAPSWNLYMYQEADTAKRSYLKADTVNGKVLIRNPESVDAQGTNGASLTRRDFVEGEIDSRLYTKTGAGAFFANTLADIGLGYADFDACTSLLDCLEVFGNAMRVKSDNYGTVYFGATIDNSTTLGSFMPHDWTVLRLTLNGAYLLAETHHRTASSAPKHYTGIQVGHSTACSWKQVIDDTFNQEIKGYTSFTKSGSEAVAIGNDHYTPLLLQRNSGGNINIRFSDTTAGTGDLYAGKASNLFAIGNNPGLHDGTNRFVWFDATGAHLPEQNSQSTYVGALTRYDFVMARDAENVKLSGNQTLTGNKTFQNKTYFDSTVVLGSDTANIRYQGGYGTGDLSMVRMGGSAEDPVQVFGDPSSKNYVYGKDLFQVVLAGTSKLKVENGGPSTNVVAPTEDHHLTRKDYVDGLDAENVKIEPDQEIHGLKTFWRSGNNNLVVSSGANSNSQSTLTLAERRTDQPEKADSYYGGYVTYEGNSNYLALGTNHSGNPHEALRINRGSYDTHTNGQLCIDSDGNRAPAPTEAYHATRKDFVEGLDAQNVKLTGDQTVAGIKNFTSEARMNNIAFYNGGTRRGHIANNSSGWFFVGNAEAGGYLRFYDGGDYEFLNTGNVISEAAPAEDTHLTNKGYVDGLDAENLKKDGSVPMTGTLSLKKAGLLIDTTTNAVDSADQYIRMGNGTYSWDLKYRGTTGGNGGNEFVIESASTGKQWLFDHDGNFQYWDGSENRNMYHDNYHPKADKADGSDGDFTVGGALVLDDMHLDNSTHRPGLLRIRGAGTTGWAGISFENSNKDSDVWSLMADGGQAGLYNDTADLWGWRILTDGAFSAYFGASTKFKTTSSGTTTVGKHVISSDGPASLDIIADTDNLNEEDTARINFNQDGGAVTASLGCSPDNHFDITAGYYGSNLNLNSGSNGHVYLNGFRGFSDNYHPNADKWTTARTLTFSGDVSGSVSLDGSVDKSISLQVGNDTHTHDGRYYTESEADSKFADKHYAYQGGDHYRGFTHLLCEVSLDNSKESEAQFNGEVTLHRGSTGSGFHHSAFHLNVSTGYTGWAADLTAYENGHSVKIGTCMYGGKKYLALRVQWFGNSQDYRLRATGVTNGHFTFDNIIHTTGNGTSGGMSTVANQEIVDSWIDKTSVITVDNIKGNASSATVSDKWNSKRKLTLTGSVSGEVEIDGSENVTLHTTSDTDTDAIARKADLAFKLALAGL